MHLRWIGSFLSSIKRIRAPETDFHQVAFEAWIQPEWFPKISSHQKLYAYLQMRVCHAKCEFVVEMRYKTKGLLKNTFAVENSQFISDKCNMRECLGYHCFRQCFFRLIGTRPLPEPFLIQLCIRSGVFNDVSYIVCVLFIIFFKWSIHASHFTVFQ